MEENLTEISKPNEATELNRSKNDHSNVSLVFKNSYPIQSKTS